MQTLPVGKRHGGAVATEGPKTGRSRVEVNDAARRDDRWADITLDALFPPRRADAPVARHRRVAPRLRRCTTEAQVSSVQVVLDHAVEGDGAGIQDASPGIGLQK